MPADTPRDCVCNATGHCHACLDADRRCERPDCRATCADGHACGRPPEAHDGCAKALRRPLTDEQRMHVTRATGTLIARLLGDPIMRGADEELLILAIVSGAFSIADMAKMPVGQMVESLAATFGPSAEVQS